MTDTSEAVEHWNAITIRHVKKSVARDFTPKTGVNGSMHQIIHYLNLKKTEKGWTPANW